MNALHEFTAPLSTSGWVLLAWTLGVALCFVVRIIARRWNGAGYHATVLAVLLIWLLWLVTP